MQLKRIILFLIIIKAISNKYYYNSFGATFTSVIYDHMN